MKTKSYTIKDFYERYQQNIDKETVYDIPYDQYRSIVEDYFKHIVDQVLEQSREFKLPCRLGTLCIVKRQPEHFDNRSLRIDYHESKIQGKVVYFINEHSNYYKYRCYYNKQNCLIPNKTKYQFVMTRANKRRLAQIIKNREHDYVELPK